MKALALAGAECIGASCEDSASATEESRRYEAGLAVADRRPAPRGLQSGVLAGGRYAVFQYRGEYAHIGRAFDAVFRNWVSVAGVALRPAPCLEIYVDSGRGRASRDRLTELCLPIEP